MIWLFAFDVPCGNRFQSHSHSRVFGFEQHIVGLAQPDDAAVACAEIVVLNALHPTEDARHKRGYYLFRGIARVLQKESGITILSGIIERQAHLFSELRIDNFRMMFDQCIKPWRKPVEIDRDQAKCDLHLFEE